MTTLPDGTRVENWTGHVVRIRDKSDGTAPRSCHGVQRHEFITIMPQVDCVSMHLDVRTTRIAPYVVRTEFLDSLVLPPPRDGVLLIVSSPIKLHYRGRRDDLVTPYGKLYDCNGKVVGCRELAY